MELPFIDEHRVELVGPPEELWPRLLQALDRGFRLPSGLARLLGCQDVRADGPRPLQVGSQMVGFHVSELEPPHCVVLSGRHRFARYRLAFRLDGSTLRAETRAEFPGLVGKLYRLLVIGSGGHAVVTRLLLSRLRTALR